jgi:DNA-binding NtrC family response regulator
VERVLPYQLAMAQTAMKQVEETSGVESEVEEYLDELQNDHLGMVGSSAALIALRDLARQVAASERPVLVSGPSGAGKTVVAHAIHRLGKGSGGKTPMIQVSCAAIEEHELEGLLFGTSTPSTGVLGTSGGATLVLDDVDQLPLTTQARLARALQKGVWDGPAPGPSQRVTVRVVALTSRSLQRCVRERVFRQDLLYELGVLVIAVPGLDEHREDVPALVNHFLRLRQSKLRFSTEALALLTARNWPGGVRELKNVVDRAVTLVHTPVVGPDPVTTLLAPSPIDGAIEDSLKTLVGRLLDLPVGNKLAAVEAALLEQAMQASCGNKTEAARMLGLHRKAIARKLEKHGVKRWSGSMPPAPPRDADATVRGPFPALRLNA